MNEEDSELTFTRQGAKLNEKMIEETRDYTRTHTWSLVLSHSLSASQTYDEVVEEEDEKVNVDDEDGEDDEEKNGEYK